MNKQDEEIKQLKEDFQFTLSKVSHEIRNPVTLIHGFMSMMVNKHPEVETFTYWDDIQDNMAYLMELLNELSTYNNASRLDLEKVEPAQYFKEVVNSTAVAMHYLGIILTFQSEDNLPPIMIDRTKFRESILNLLRNASEAIEKEGHITVSLQKQESYICIKITDTGCGIPEGYMDTLFDPFVTHKKGGSGLGLAIVKQVVENHKGSICVDSVEHKGTTFTILLPPAV